MNKWVVIDTNVGVVANGKHEPAELRCVAACVKALQSARKQIVVVDEDFHIFDEYRRYLSPSGQPSAGDAFFKWLWDNQGNPRYCLKVKITAIPEENLNFEEFPNDPDLANFDASDRKFVAVVLASNHNPSILNASDTDWWHYREALERNDIKVIFLCPELMRK